MKLYRAQKDCLDQIKQHLTKHNEVYVAWYTGSGKTNIFLSYIKDRLEEDPTLCVGISTFLTTEIKQQVTERLPQFGLAGKSHTIKSKQPISPNSSIYVFNPQSIIRRLVEFSSTTNRKFDVLVVDEAHAGMHTKGMLNKIIVRLSHPKTKIIYISATPTQLKSNPPVIKRTLLDGLKDGLVSNFQLCPEMAEIEFEEKDFNKKGNLKTGTTIKRLNFLTSICEGKFQNILNRYGDTLGQKVLVICPPGGASSIATYLATKHGGLAYVEDGKGRDTRQNINLFKYDPTVRFLFVVYKCGIGFDMKELDTVVDLTMTRNVPLLVQRVGRVARRNGQAPKKYFYIYDKSNVSKVDRVIADWIHYAAHGGLFSTRIVGATSTNFMQRLKEPTTFAEIVEILSQVDALSAQERIRLAEIEATQRKAKYTSLEKALEDLTKYNSRMDLMSRNMALYHYMRRRHRDKLDELLPRKYATWDIETIRQRAKNYTTKQSFKKSNKGMYEYLVQNKLLHEIAFLGKPYKKWDGEKIVELFPTLPSWSHIRTIGGARSWLQTHGLESKYRGMYVEWKRKQQNSKGEG